jgi:hypothetical protein
MGALKASLDAVRARGGDGSAKPRKPAGKAAAGKATAGKAKRPSAKKPAAKSGASRPDTP